MAHRRLIEAINESRILYDSDPDLIGYGRHNSRAVIRPAYSRYSYDRRDPPPFQHKNNSIQARNYVGHGNDDDHKQQIGGKTEKVLERLVVTDVNSVSRKVSSEDEQDNIQDDDKRGCGTHQKGKQKSRSLLKLGKSEKVFERLVITDANSVSHKDLQVQGKRLSVVSSEDNIQDDDKRGCETRQKGKRSKNMYKILKKKFRRWKKKMKRNGEETIARHTSFNLFCFRRKQKPRSPYQLCNLENDESGSSESNNDSMCTASKEIYYLLNIIYQKLFYNRTFIEL